MNMRVQHGHNFPKKLSIYLGSSILDLIIRLYLTVRNYQIVLQSGCTFCIPTNNESEFLLLSLFTNNQYCQFICMYICIYMHICTIIIGSYWYLIVLIYVGLLIESILSPFLLTRILYNILLLFFSLVSLITAKLYFLKRSNFYPILMVKTQ